MNAAHQQAHMAMLAQRMQDISRDIEALAAAGREDEANQRKAARNIYGICTQVLRAVGDEAAYEEQLCKLRTAWAQAKDLASAHDDFARVALEDVKLAALADVQAHWDARTRGACV